MMISIVKNWGKLSASSDLKSIFYIPYRFDGIHTSDFTITFYNRDFMIIAFNDLQDFFNGLIKFLITNASADIKGNNYFCFMTHIPENSEGGFECFNLVIFQNNT